MMVKSEPTPNTTSFTASCCLRWGLFATARADDGESSMRPAETSRKRSSVLRKIAIISPTTRESPFGLRAVQKSIDLPGSCAKSAEEAWKAQSFVVATARVITRSSSKTRMATNWKSAVAKILSSPGESQPQHHRQRDKGVIKPVTI